MESQRQEHHTFSGGGIMSWHNMAKGYTWPGGPECSTSLRILSTEEMSKGAWILICQNINKMVMYILQIWKLCNTFIYNIWHWHISRSSFYMTAFTK